MDCESHLHVENARAKICLHAHNDLISNTLRETHIWDMPTCQRAARLVGNGSMVDVGANIGAISLCILLLNPSLESLVSIEATTWNFNLLNATNRLYGDSKWTVLQAALDSEDNRMLHFHGNDKNLGGSTAIDAQYHPHRTNGWHRNPNKRSSVASITLDNQMRGRQCASVLKLDVEGFERFVLDGYREHLSHASTRPCHILMEWHRILLDAAGKARGIDENVEELYSNMIEWGYETEANPMVSHDLVVWYRAEEGTCCTRG